MPCFRSAPDREDPEYAAWAERVEEQFDSIVHVVDYYYGKSGLSMPQPHTLDCWEEWLLGGKRDAPVEKPSDSITPVDTKENQRVLRQILLHLDCDEVTEIQLNDIRNYLIKNPSPKRMGYGYIVDYCFVAMRKEEF